MVWCLAACTPTALVRAASEPVAEPVAEAEHVAKAEPVAEPAEPAEPAGAEPAEPARAEPSGLRRARSKIRLHNSLLDNRLVASRHR